MGIYSYSDRYPRILSLGATMEDLNQVVQALWDLEGEYSVGWGAEGEVPARNEAEEKTKESRAVLYGDVPPDYSPDNEKIRREDQPHLLRAIRKREFRGLLVIVLGSELSKPLESLLTHGRHEITREMIRILKSSDPKLDLPSVNARDLGRVLAIAEIACREGGSAVVVCPRNRTNKIPGDIRFHFTVEEPEAIDVNYLGALTLRRKAGFLVAERLGRRLDITPPNAAWDQWSFDHQAELETLIDIELTNKDARWQFDEICEASTAWVASEQIGERDEDRAAIEPLRFRRLALTIIRMARRLSTYTLEGTPYEFTLHLPNRPIGSSPTAIAMDTAAFINFDDAEIVKDHTEMAQSCDLVMVVNPEKGTLSEINKRTDDNSALARHLEYAKRLRDAGGLWIHVKNGRVEVYGPWPRPGTSDSTDQFNEIKVTNRMDLEVTAFALRHDGFRWEAAPFVELRNHLRKAFPRERDNESIDTPFCLIRNRVLLKK